MSVSAFQAGTVAMPQERANVAADVDKWIAQDKDELKLKALEEKEAKRQAGAQRAMREALAEQQEMIEKNALRISAQNDALAKLDLDAAIQQGKIQDAIKAKDRSTEERLRARHLDIQLSMAKHRAENETSKLNAKNLRTQLEQLKQEARYAKADEAERQRSISKRRKQIEDQRKQLKVIEINRQRAEAHKKALEEQEKCIADAQIKLKAIIASNDAAGRKRLQDQGASMAKEMQQKKEELEHMLIEAEERRTAFINSAKERIQQDSEEAERLRMCAVRRAAVLAEAEQRDTILRNEQRRKAWEAEIEAIELRKSFHQIEFRKAVEKKDEDAQIRIQETEKKLQEDIKSRKSRIEETAIAIRECRERLEHDERERKQQMAEEAERSRFAAARRALVAKEAESLRLSVSNSKRQQKVMQKKKELEENKARLTTELKDAIALSDEMALARLHEATQANERKMQEQSKALQLIRKEAEKRRNEAMELEQQLKQLSAEEANRMRTAAARRATALKEKEQMDVIIRNRTKDERSKERIASIEKSKNIKEQQWRDLRRRNSIIGHERLEEQRKQAQLRHEEKSAANKERMKAASERKAARVKVDIRERADRAKKIAEKEQKARDRIDALNEKRQKNQKKSTKRRVKREHPADDDAAALRIQALHRGRGARRRSLALKEKKKRQEAMSALSLQSAQKEILIGKNKIMSRAELKAPGLAVMKVDAEDAAALSIQKIERGRQGRKKSAKAKHTKKQNAATKIQSHARGNITRKKAPPVKLGASPYNQKRTSSRPTVPKGPNSTRKTGTSRGARALEASNSV